MNLPEQSFPSLIVVGSLLRTLEQVTREATEPSATPQTQHITTEVLTLRAELDRQQKSVGDYIELANQAQRRYALRFVLVVVFLPMYLDSKNVSFSHMVACNN